MSAQTVATTSSAGAERIHPRRLRRPSLRDAPLHWLGGDPYFSTLLNALSLVFPPGERHFVLSVRAVMDRLDDPELLEDVRGFITQESWHSREHAEFNAWLSSFGIDAQGVMESVEQELEWLRQNRTKERSLAITCALEHFTALMAESWLRADDLREQAHPAVRDLWTWHAIEEIEHRAVAFDVFQAAGGSYFTRTSAMAILTFGFVVSTGLLQWSLLGQAGERGNLRSIRRGLWRSWGPRGLFTRLIPRYLSYYRPSFHPLQHDASDLVERFEQQLQRSGALGG